MNALYYFIFIFQEKVTSLKVIHLRFLTYNMLECSKLQLNRRSLFFANTSWTFYWYALTHHVYFISDTTVVGSFGSDGTSTCFFILNFIQICIRRDQHYIVGRFNLLREKILDIQYTPFGSLDLRIVCTKLLCFSLELLVRTTVLTDGFAPQ